MRRFYTYIISILLLSTVWSQNEGCTDPLAENYDPNATFDNGSCFGSSVNSEYFTFSGTLDGNHYYFSSNNASWQDAKIICENQGGHLATITSEEENNGNPFDILVNCKLYIKPHASETL